MSDSLKKTNPFNTSNGDFDISFEQDDWDILPPAVEHRLNDYDNNLFSENAYKKVDDEIFQIEYKITRLEAKLKSIDSQIQSSKAMNDFAQLDTLKIKKHQYERELEKLHQMYEKQDISSKLSGGIINFVTSTPKKSNIIMQNFAEFLNSKVFSKLSGRFNTNLHIKEALIQLENINKNVDDLVSAQTPYNDSTDKYDQLLQYLNKANVIQYQISQMVNNKKR